MKSFPSDSGVESFHGGTTTGIVTGSATGTAAGTQAGPAATSTAATSAAAPRLITRFGERVDVRNRGAMRMGRFAGSQAQDCISPAVVRVWHAEHCREMTTHEARSFAAQLLEAAALAESQNSH